MLFQMVSCKNMLPPKGVSNMSAMVNCQISFPEPHQKAQRHGTGKKGPHDFSYLRIPSPEIRDMGDVCTGTIHIPEAAEWEKT